MNHSFDPKFQSIYHDALIKAGIFPGALSFDSTSFSGVSQTLQPADNDWRNLTSTSAMNQQASISNDRDDHYQRRRSRSRSRDRYRRRSRSRSRDRRSRSRERHRRRSRSRSDSRYASRSPPRHRRTPSPDPISSKIMMNNLPIDASRDTISYLMARQGFHALDIRIVRRTSESGMVRVFGFVEFNTPAQAQSWMKYCDGTLFFEDGTRARLEFSREMDDNRRPVPGSSDWTCAKCTINNFNRRSNCFKCGTSRKESEAMEAKGYALVGVHPSDTLLIRELPASATEEIVRTSLAQYTGCVIQRVYVAPSKSYALIQMKSVEDASYVLSTFNKLVPYIDNCAVIVTFSRLSLNQVLLKDNVNALKSQSGITSANIQQDPTNSAALLAQNALMMVQMGKHKPTAIGGIYPSTVADTMTAARESVSTPFGYLQSYPTPDRATFQLEPVSGYMYDSTTTFYFDPKTEYYFNSKLNQWMFWCSRYSTYIPCEGGDQELKKRLQADEKAEQRTRSSAIISAPPSASMAGDELAHISSVGASSADQNKIARMLQACMEQNKMIMTVLNKLPDAKATDKSNTLKRCGLPASPYDDDMFEIDHSRKLPLTNKRIFVNGSISARSILNERRVVVDKDVIPRDRIVMMRRSKSPEDCGRPESAERRCINVHLQPNVNEAIRAVECINGRDGPLPDWDRRIRPPSPRHRPMSCDRRLSSTPPIRPPRRCRWSDREEGSPQQQPLQKSPIIQKCPVLPSALNVPPILTVLSGLLPSLRPGRPISAGMPIPFLPMLQSVPPPRLSVAPDSMPSVHIRPPVSISMPIQTSPIASILDCNCNQLTKLERDRQCEELMKQAMADREKEHLARRQQLLVKEQEDIQSLNICLNCGRRGHPQEKCRRSRISDEALKRIITNAREQRDKEQILKEKMKKQALEKYKCKRNDPLISRLRDVVPDGKIMKPVFNAMCENCSQFGHTKLVCRNAAVNRSVVREVREAINEFLRVFFFNFQDGEVLDFSKKFQLFKMMDMVEASEIDPVNLQLREMCSNGIVRIRDLQLCSNCASLGHKSQYCAQELSDRRYYEKILQLVTAYRALVKEKGHILLKNFVPPPKKTNANGDLITLDDSDGEKKVGGSKPDSDDDVEWIVNSGDEIELADEERDEEEETAISTKGMLMTYEVRADEDDEIVIVDMV